RHPLLGVLLQRDLRIVGREGVTRRAERCGAKTRRKNVFAHSFPPIDLRFLVTNWAHASRSVAKGDTSNGEFRDRQRVTTAKTRGFFPAGNLACLRRNAKAPDPRRP